MKEKANGRKFWGRLWEESRISAQKNASTLRKYTIGVLLLLCLWVERTDQWDFHQHRVQWLANQANASQSNFSVIRSALGAQGTFSYTCCHSKSEVTQLLSSKGWLSVSTVCPSDSRTEWTNHCWKCVSSLRNGPLVNAYAPFATLALHCQRSMGRQSRWNTWLEATQVFNFTFLSDG